MVVAVVALADEEGPVSVPLKKSDPCYWMLEEGLADPSKRSKTDVYRAGCYICEDPEFSLMGLPLCYACPKCKGHVAADDTRCDGCGHDCQHDGEEAARAASDPGYAGDGGEP